MVPALVMLFIGATLVHQSPPSTAAFIDPSLFGPATPPSSSSSQLSLSSSVPAYLTSGEEIPYCSDTTIQYPEQCDDGNTLNGDGCSEYCTIEQCGDGSLASDEQCDDGNAMNGDGCSSDCSIEYCGDSTLQASLGEECDDGNNVNGDGCSNVCFIEQSSSSSSVSLSSSTASSPLSSASSASSIASSQSPLHSAAPITQANSINAIIALNTASLSQQETALIHAVLNGQSLSPAQQALVEPVIEKIVAAVRYADTVLEMFLKDILPTDTLQTLALSLSALDAPVYTQDSLSLSLRNIMHERGHRHMTIDPQIWNHTEEALSRGNPLDMLSALLAVRAIVAAEAPENVDAVALFIGQTARSLLASDVLLREYPDLDASRVHLALSALAEASDASPVDIESMLARFDALFKVLARGKVNVRALETTVPPLNDRSGFSRIASQAGLDAQSAREIADALPVELKTVFAEGTPEERRQAILSALASHAIVDELIQTLPPDARSQAIQRKEALMSKIKSTTSPPSLIIEQDVMPFLRDLQTEINATLSPFDLLIQKLQNLFHIS